MFMVSWHEFFMNDGYPGAYWMHVLAIQRARLRKSKYSWTYMRVQSAEMNETVVYEQRCDVIQRLWRDAVLSLLQIHTERLSAADPQHLS